MRIAHNLLAAALVLGLSAPALAQGGPPPLTKTIGLAGPRVGFTSLSPGMLETLKENGFEVRPLMTQFGWQFEKQFYGKGRGLAALSEWVVLVGGLEQGLAVPSLNWIVGLRTKEGAEFGVGPNLTPAGAALAVAAGVTFRTGGLNIPMNVAMVPSRDGVRVSLLTGFNFRRR